jgi:hypothetical protein
LSAPQQRWRYLAETLTAGQWPDCDIYKVKSDVYENGILVPMANQ